MVKVFFSVPFISSALSGGGRPTLESLRKEKEELEVFDFIVEEAKLQSQGGADKFEQQLAQAAAQCPLLNDIRKSTASRGISLEERVAISAIFVRHASERSRVGRIDWTRPIARTLYCVRAHPAARVIKRCALVCLLSLAFFEPASTWTITRDQAELGPATPYELVVSMPVSVLELLSVSLLTLDALAMTISRSPRALLSDRQVYEMQRARPLPHRRECYSQRRRA